MLSYKVNVDSTTWAGSVHGNDLMFSLERIGKDLSKMLDNRTTLRAFIISSPRHRRARERHLPPDGIGNLSIPETAPVARGHVPAGVGTTKYVHTFGIRGFHPLSAVKLSRILLSSLYHAVPWNSPRGKSSSDHPFGKST